MAERTGPIQLEEREVTQLAHVLADSLQQAETDRKQHLHQLESYRDLYKPVQLRNDKPWETACELHIPLLKFLRNAMSARINRALLSTNPIAYVDPWEPQMQAVAGMVEQFLYDQAIHQIRVPQRLRACIDAALDDGGGFAYVTFKEEYRRKKRIVRSDRAVFDEDTGALLLAAGDEREERVLLPHYCGPEIVRVPMEYIGTFPAANGSIEDNPGVYVKLTMTGNDLLAGIQAGDYDKAAVERLRTWTGDPDHLARVDDTIREVTANSSSISVDGNFHNRPFAITEWYYRYGERDDEPASDWLVTMHQPTRTVLRAIPNPWGHGRRPIAAFHVLPPRYGLIGESLPELCGDSQKFLTLLMQLMVDNMSLRIWPELVFGSGITAQEYADFVAKRGPGKHVRFAGADDMGKVVRTLQYGISANEALPLVETLYQWAQRSSGISDTMLGRAIPHQVTATEMERLLEEGQELVMAMTDAAADGVQTVFELILALDYEFADRETLQRRWLKVTQQQEIPLRDALGLDYDITVAGTTATANRALKKQRAVELFTALKDDPYINADLTGRRGYELRKSLLVDGYGVRKPETLIGSEQEAMLLPAVQGQLA